MTAPPPPTLVDRGPGTSASRRATRRGRPRVAFLAWSSVAGRSSEIAAALGGEAHCSHPRRLAGRGRLTPLRYLVSLADSSWYLLRRRPRAVIATNPPVFPGVLALAYSRLAQVPFLLDSHPTGFGAKGNRQAQLMGPVHRTLARRAAATLVTSPHWVDQLARWGARGQIVHEAPDSWQVSPCPAHEEPLRVLCISVFGGDEPVRAVVEGARRVPGVEVRITGDRAKAPQGMVEGAPPNVRFLGYLDQPAYRRAIRDAHAVLCLTTEPTSVMRSACEAVWAGRPLIVSDFPDLRAAFPDAVPAANDPTGIAAALDEVGQRYAELVATAADARRRQDERWEGQLSALRELIADPTRR